MGDLDAHPDCESRDLHWTVIYSRKACHRLPTQIPSLFAAGVHAPLPERSLTARSLQISTVLR